MITVDAIRAERCADCGAAPDSPCIVRGTDQQQEHQMRRLLRIVAGVRVHPIRWAAAANAYREAAHA